MPTGKKRNDLASRLLAVIDVGLARGESDALVILRHRMLITGSLVGLVAFSTLPFALASLGARLTPALLAGTGILWTLNLVQRRRGASLQRCVRVVLVSLAALGALGALENGGPGAVTNAVMLPTAAALLTGKRGALAGAATGLAIVFGCWALGQSRFALLNVAPLSMLDLVLVSTAIVLTSILVTMFAMLQEALASRLAATATQRERDATRIQLLLDVATAAERFSTPEEVLENVLPSLHQAFDVALAAWWRAREDDTWECIGAHVRDPDLPGWAALATVRLRARAREPLGTAPTEVAAAIAYGHWLEIPVDTGPRYLLQLWEGERDTLDEDTLVLAARITARVGDALARLAARQEVSRLAFTDALTGLPNRSSFDAALERALADAAQQAQRVALLFIDLNGFKEINDQHGHEIGDLVLRAAARRLSSCIRFSDSLARTSLVARRGGDEFTMLLTDLRDLSGAEIVARRVLDALQSPVLVEGKSLRIGASIGIALFPDDAESGAELLRIADAAMYEAKALDRSAFCFHGRARAEKLEA